MSYYDRHLPSVHNIDPNITKYQQNFFTCIFVQRFVGGVWELQYINYGTSENKIEV